LLKNFYGGFGSQEEKLKIYKENFLKLKSFTFEVGINDEYRWLYEGNIYFDELLTKNDVPHKFVTFNGGHQNIVGDRLKNFCLPELSAAMVYDPSITDAKDDVGVIPQKFNLTAYPNPFNPSTTINFSVPEFSLINIEVYDSLGKKIITLFNERTKSGNYEIIWNPKNISSGVYFCRISNGMMNEVQKLIFQK
jgi:hypothetical protein